jgi:transcriptional regulator with PAS, ATPase and Fis domain
MRVLAATNVDLSVSLARGTLREDFYYRINIIPVHLPPLRERLEDLALLVEHILHHHSFALEKKIQRVSPRVFDQMLAYHWPGNVRELANILERAIVKCSAEVIDEVDLPAPPRPAAEPSFQGNGLAGVSLKQWVSKSEKDYLRELLIKHKGKIGATAKEAKVDDKTLYRKMKRYGLDKESFKPSS